MAATPESLRKQIKEATETMEQVGIHLNDVNDEIDEFEPADHEAWEPYLARIIASLRIAEDDARELAGRTEED
jgi:hypothetical protein